MLKIDLLPRHIRDRRRVPFYAAVCGVIFVVLALALGLFIIVLGTNVSKLGGEVKELTAKAKEVTDLEAQVTTLQGEASTVNSRVEFAQAAQNTGPAWAAYIEGLSQWVPANAYLDSWIITENTLTWTGSLQLRDPFQGLTSDEYMRFLVNLRRCPMLSNAALEIEGLDEGYSYAPQTSSFSPGEEFVPFRVTADLVSPPSYPEFKAAAQAAAARAAAAAAAAAKAAAPGAAVPSAAAVGGGAPPAKAEGGEEEELGGGTGKG